MSDVSTVTSNSTTKLPARIRKKHCLALGRKVRFPEVEGGLLLVPVLSLKELDGVAREKTKTIMEGIRELNWEHRAEAAREG